jgi:hypothetical protein
MIQTSKTHETTAEQVKSFLKKIMPYNNDDYYIATYSSTFDYPRKGGITIEIDACRIDEIVDAAMDCSIDVRAITVGTNMSGHLSLHISNFKGEWVVYTDEACEEMENEN